MEILCPSEVQILCLASNPKSALDLRQTESKGATKPSHLPTMHTYSRNGYASVHPVPILFKSMEVHDGLVRGLKTQATSLGASWSIDDRWTTVAGTRGLLGKAVVMVLILITWEIWKERNARIFYNKSTVPRELLAKIKEKGRMWSLAGAKCLEQFCIL